MNLLVRLQGMEGKPAQESFNHRAEDRLQELKEILLEEIREVAPSTEGTDVFMGGMWLHTLNKYIAFVEEHTP